MECCVFWGGGTEGALGFGVALKAPVGSNCTGLNFHLFYNLCEGSFGTILQAY